MAVREPGEPPELAIIKKCKGDLCNVRFDDGFMLVDVPATDLGEAVEAPTAAGPETPAAAADPTAAANAAATALLASVPFVPSMRIDGWYAPGPGTAGP